MYTPMNDVHYNGYQPLPPPSTEYNPYNSAHYDYNGFNHYNNGGYPPSVSQVTDTYNYNNGFKNYPPHHHPNKNHSRYNNHHRNHNGNYNPTRHKHNNSNAAETVKPIFNSPSTHNLPNFMSEFLVNHNPPPHPRANAKLLLEQILKSYLVDFWRHQVEKEGGEKRLWAEITNNTHTYCNSIKSWWNMNTETEEGVYLQTIDYIAEREEASPLEEGEMDTSNDTSSSEYSSNSCSSNSSSSRIANTPTIIDSPSCSDSSSNSPANNPIISPTSNKTRWQHFAEQLFCMILRVNQTTFNIHQHMEPLLKMCTARKDAELTDIIGNYVSTIS